jgi:hypothetical protein
VATRFYLTNTAAPYTPTTKRGAWDTSSATLARHLGSRPSGTAATTALAETSSTNNFDVLWGRWVSDGATAAGTLSGTVEWIAGVLEANADANSFFHLHIYVTQGDSDTPRGTLLTDSIGATEFPTGTAAGRGEGAKAISSLAISVGDRLVVEIGFQNQNTHTTSRNVTLQYGGTGTTDRVAGNTTAGNPGWLEFSGTDGLFGALTSTVQDTFSAGSLADPPWGESYGGATVSGGEAVVPCAHTAGVPDYAGIQTDAVYRFDEVRAKITPASANGATVTAYTALAITDPAVEGTSLHVRIDAVAGQLRLESNVDYFDGSATVLTYSGTDHLHARLRRSGGNVLFETSPDDSTWTTRRTLTEPAWVRYGGLNILGEAARDGGTNNTASFDNINTVGGSNVDGAAAANLGALAATAAGTREVLGQAAAFLNVVTATASGQRAVSGAAAASLGALTATSAGQRGVFGLAGASLGGLAAVSAGTASTPAVPTAHTDQTPALTDVDNGSPIATGVRLTSDGTRPIRAIVWWVPDTNEGTYTAQLWRTDTDDSSGTGTGTLLEEFAAAAADVAPGWSRIPIDPVMPAVGTVWTASVHSSSGRYVARSGEFAEADIAAGGITLVQSGSDPAGIGTIRNGVFVESGSPAYPASSFGSTDYYVDVELGDPAVEGQASANLGGLAATAAGQRGVVGQAQASLGAVAAAAVGQRAVAGQAAASLGGVGAAATGQRSTAGAAVAPLGGLSAAMLGQRTVLGAATAALGSLTATAAGEVQGEKSGTATAILGGLAATAAGQRAVPGSAATILGFTAAAAGQRTVSGVATASLGGLVAAAAGRREVVGQAAAPLGGLAGTTSGIRTVLGVAGTSLGFTAGAAGRRDVSGQVTAALGGLSATAHGAVPDAGPPVTLAAVGPPMAGWAVGEPGGGWLAGAPTAGWSVGPPTL